MILIVIKISDLNHADLNRPTLGKIHEIKRDGITSLYGIHDVIDLK